MLSNVHEIHIFQATKEQNQRSPIGFSAPALQRQGADRRIGRSHPPSMASPSLADVPKPQRCRSPLRGQSPCPCASSWVGMELWLIYIYIYICVWYISYKIYFFQYIYYIILYYIVLYYIILYYIILYCIILYYIILYWYMSDVFLGGPLHGQPIHTIVFTSQTSQLIFWHYP